MLTPRGPVLRHALMGCLGGGGRRVYIAVCSVGSCAMGIGTFSVYTAIRPLVRGVGVVGRDGLIVARGLDAVCEFSGTGFFFFCFLFVTLGW